METLSFLHLMDKQGWKFGLNYRNCCPGYLTLPLVVYNIFLNNGKAESTDMSHLPQNNPPLKTAKHRKRDFQISLGEA